MAVDGPSGEPGPNTTGIVKIGQRTVVGSLAVVSPKALSLVVGLGGLCGKGLSQREV